MHVGTDDFGNATSQEVPYNNTTIIATDSQQSAMFVKCTCQCHTDAIQCAIGVLHQESKAVLQTIK